VFQKKNSEKEKEKKYQAADLPMKQSAASPLYQIWICEVCM